MGYLWGESIWRNRKETHGQRVAGADIVGERAHWTCRAVAKDARKNSGRKRERWRGRGGDDE